MLLFVGHCHRLIVLVYNFDYLPKVVMCSMLVVLLVLYLYPHIAVHQNLSKSNLEAFYFKPIYNNQLLLLKFFYKHFYLYF